MGGARNSDATEITTNKEQNHLLSKQLYSRRGQSAQASKKVSLRDVVPNNKDMEATLPMVGTSGKNS